MEGSPWGGSEELWHQVAVKALEKGYEIQVCVKYWNDEPSKIIQLRNLGAKIIKRKPPKTTLVRRITRKMFKELIKEGYIKDIKKFSPDRILISQGATFDVFYNQALTDLLITYKVPFFLISQFNFEQGQILSGRLRNLVINLSELWKKFYFVSERNLTTAERQLAIKLPETCLIDNPVNIKNIGVSVWPENKTLHMACIARYDCAYKGQDILLHALSNIKYRHINLKLNMFGHGPDKEHLQRLVYYYNLQNKVTINDHISDIDHIWETHHILVLPSISEGTPLSLQECVLKGRPALVTNVGDCNKIIIDGISGFLACNASVDSLTLKLDQLFATSLNNLRAMGEKAYEMTREKINLNSPSIILSDIESAI
jgi:glycosyltransferase involved in cell wall biosynthesis